MSEKIIRIIPEFPQYYMDQDGNIFNKDSKQQVQPIRVHPNDKTLCVNLYKNGCSWMRSVNKIHRSLFPKGRS